MSIITTPENLGLETTILQQEAKKAFDSGDLDMYFGLLNQIVLNEMLMFYPQVSLCH